MKDALDVEVEVGCTVVYPRRQSSSCWHGKGRVVEVGCTVVYPRRQSSSCWHGKGRVVEVDERRQRVKLTGGDAKEKYDAGSGEWRSVPMRDRWVQGGRHLVVSKGTV